MFKELGASTNLPALGPGISYNDALDPLLVARPELFPVVEFEPQTTWIQTEPGYRADPEVLRHLAELPGRKLIHSVAAPVGGSVPPGPGQLRLLRTIIEELDSPWMSEHLSFNQTADHSTGFFLPPLQTLEGLRAARRNIGDLQRAFPVPVAIENGVSYLQPRPGEWTDAEITAQVAEASDCGLVLDLHNLYTNARNGRQPVEEFLDRIPLDRVWEIHLAGGMEMNGFWLDAHSGAIPQTVLETARNLIPRLPRLKAIIFEIYPSFIPEFGLQRVADEMERLHELWALRPAGGEAQSDCLGWEQALGSLTVGRAHRSALAAELAEDPGSRLVEGLVHEFRASMISRNLRLTTRLLMLSIGPGPLRTLLRGFYQQTTPRMYGSSEAEAFAAYLEALNLQVPHLANVLAFERAAIASLIDGQTRVLEFDVEPLPLLRSLAEGRLPESLPQAGRFEVAVTG